MKKSGEGSMVATNSFCPLQQSLAFIDHVRPRQDSGTVNFKCISHKGSTRVPLLVPRDGTMQYQPLGCLKVSIGMGPRTQCQSQRMFITDIGDPANISLGSMMIEPLANIFHAIYRSRNHGKPFDPYPIFIFKVGAVPCRGSSGNEISAHLEVTCSCKVTDWINFPPPKAIGYLTSLTS